MHYSLNVLEQFNLDNDKAVYFFLNTWKNIGNIFFYNLGI